MSKKQLVIYSRTMPCAYTNIAKRVLKNAGISYQEINIDADLEARQRVLGWTGFLSVPTLVLANPGEILPYEDPAPLPKGASPKGVDRGSMLTEANAEQLEAWLRKHQLIGTA
jgi:glutaredoxin